MLKRLIFYSLILTIFSCAFLRKEYTGIHRKVIPYVRLFEKKFYIKNNKLDNLTIGFGQLEKHVLGRCNFFTKEITINIKHWNDLNDRQKTTLIYHELGHCVLWKFHQEGLLEDFCPKSIMYKELPSNNCLMKHWNYYNKEFYGTM